MPGRWRRRRHSEARWQRTRWVAIGVVAAVGATGATGVGSSGAAPRTPIAPAQAAEPFNLGISSAVAQGLKIDPRAAGLSLGITVAESLAGHQNSVAAAESKAINLGIIGTTLAAEGCDGGDPTLPRDQQPQTLRRDSTEADAAGGVREQEQVPPGTPVEKFVLANTQPYAQSITTGAPLVIPGLLSIAGMVSETTSGVINGNTREARAVSQIASLDIAAGAIHLGGMRWEAVHRSGAVEETFGSFTIGSMSIGGVPVPVEDPTAALAQVNTLLNALGIELRPPITHSEETASGVVTFVDPLALAVVPNSQRDLLVGGLLTQVQPQREQLFDALLEMDCGNATYILVLDIVLGSITGAGSFAINLGGAQASTASINAFQGLGAGGAGRLLPPAAPPAAAGSGALNAPTINRTSPAPAVVPDVAAAPDQPAAAPQADAGDVIETIADTEGDRGGAMLWVGLAGLAALALAAELDRRKMRRAQRLIPAEV